MIWRAIAWGLSLISVAGPLIVLDGPGGVEAIFAPVADERGIERTSLLFENGKLTEICWTLKFKKLRDAKPYVFMWKIKRPNQHDSDAIILDMDYAKQIAPITKKGSTRGFENCARIPPEFDQGPKEIFALAEYYTWHGLWTIPRYPERLVID